MRFTRGDYFLLPENMRQLLLECLTRTDVTMIVIGFGMQSEEFSRLIATAAQERNIRIFILEVGYPLDSGDPKM